MTTPSRVAVVGAGPAGIDCASELRRRGYEGLLTVYSAEDERPYDRPPLSKEYLSGEWNKERLALQSAAFFDTNDVTLSLGDPVLGLDVTGRTLTAARSGTSSFDAVVIGTGLRPVTLGPAGDDRVLTVRNLDDADLLRRHLAVPGQHVVVVGTGYLGCELAATARVLGAHVTLVGSDGLLLGRQLSPAVGHVLTRVHQDNDIVTRTGVGVVSVDRAGEVRSVLLGDGTRLEADVVVVAIGSRLNTEWLAGTGLAGPEGIHCDARFGAAPGVWAVGDVAAVPGADGTGWKRHEHRLHATESAMRVAGAVLGEADDLPPSVPYVWSDQFGHRLQIYGSVPTGVTPAFTHVDVAKTQFVAVYADGKGDVAAVVGCNLPRATRLARAWVVERRPLADVPGLLDVEVEKEWGPSPQQAGSTRGGTA